MFCFFDPALIEIHLLSNFFEKSDIVMTFSSCYFYYYDVLYKVVYNAIKEVYQIFASCAKFVGLLIGLLILRMLYCAQ